MLANKKILVVGGNGYVGKYIANVLEKSGAKVYTLSRKGNSDNPKIHAIKGDIMQAEKQHQLINQMDVIVDTVGTLVDTSITKGAKPGEPGTYEQMNRDTFLALLKEIDSKKTVFYVSASGPVPPFLKRYFKAKIQAEQALQKSPNNGYILKPGMIYSREAKWWTFPMKMVVNSWRGVYKFMQRTTPRLAGVLKPLEVSEPTALKDIAQTVAYLSANDYDADLLYNKEMEELSRRFQESSTGNQSS